MLEELASDALYRQCEAIRDRTPLVYPKGQTWGKKIDPLADFFQKDDRRLRYDLLPNKRLDGRSFRADAEITKAWRWFNRMDEKIIDAYIRRRWSNDLRSAMLEAGTYNALHEDWLDFFKKRREKFMEKTEAAIRAISAWTTEMTKTGKIPQSHGGVANLLKVLTRTMREQKSGIESIAKMQYAICMQAGIYIVPEFLTDVLVAEELMRE